MSYRLKIQFQKIKKSILIRKQLAKSEGMKTNEDKKKDVVGMEKEVNRDVSMIIRELE